MFRVLSLLRGSPVCEIGVARAFSSTSVVNLGQPQSTMTMFQSLLKAATGHPGLISPSLHFEQKRYYWGHEGRIGYRRRRAKEMRERVKILNPSSPVIDYRVPWPKDDTESLPSDLFGQQIRELSREEVSLKQNLILQQINGQIESKNTGRLFAVVHLSGKQFKVTPEDIIIVQGTFAPNIGDQIRLHKVLLVGSKDFTLIGRPIIDQDLTRVEATVIEKTLSYTKMNFIMKAKKNFRRLRFHKTPYTMLRINLIDIMEPLGASSTETDTWEQEPLKTLL
ncbi:39S ribosomal protein L21, mitochondrial [Orchesella cincta]|uniref:Large ribosomal subunit protein bL21m n=1 Tax=Orchesella cincta TaxID=48709 RepID=A0A1D2NAB7_ORCCI|nr:39S ribosomal protein L21, mitochondrial [Orchesella cincta]